VNGRLALPRFDLVSTGIGALATAFAVMFVERMGTPLGLGVLLGLTAFVAIVLAYAAVPHIAVAATIPYFALVPTLKIFVHPLVGATKDLVALAALTAAAAVFLRRRVARRAWIPDRFALVVVAFLFALYVVNVGGALSGETGHGPAWFHGVRLIFEPIALLLVGLSLRDPPRTLRWGALSLVATGVVMALIGFAQQALGVGRLMSMGFSYGNEVREAYGLLRSFGTVGEPFAYAGFMLLASAVALLWGRGRWASIASAVILLGLAVSFVRTAALIVLALLGLALAHRGHVRFAFFMLLSSVVAAATIFAIGSQQTSTRLVQVSPNQYLTLNGRTELWEEALGTSPGSWMFGRGVGATGTASQRAESTLTGAERSDVDEGEGDVVDSAYFATVADVGLIGLGLLLALFSRVLFLAWRAARSGDRSGSLGLGILTVLLLDALTRESLTGFPTAYIGMLLAGLSLAALRRNAEPAPTANGRNGRAP
jgi:O-antigen ligase